MLVYGKHGMGQHFIGSALLHKFERLHVQNFDLSVLYGDSARVSAHGEGNRTDNADS